MSKSALSRPQVHETVGRSAADLSTIKNFNQSAGMLQPILARGFIAGTDGYLDRRSFCRTKTPAFAPFQQISQNVDVFLVPVRYLFSPWNDWKLNINDINSSLFQGNPASSSFPNALMTSLPRLDFGSSLYSDLLTCDVIGEGSPGPNAQSYVNNALRLFDMLGYGHDTAFWTVACQMNLFMLAAYQKVYYDHYRNTAYEPNNSIAYNLDWLWNNNSGLLDRSTIDVSNPSREAYALYNLCKLRYVNYRNDYFHNVYPSLNMVSLAITPNTPSWSIPSDVGQLLVGSRNQVGQAGTVLAVGSVSSTGSYINGGVSNSGFVSGSSASGISVQSIRAAFALDKLMRASAYAPKHVKDQFKARFDVDVPDSVGMESIRVGSWQNDITFGEVTSTANTFDSTSGEGDSLGAIGGKGVGAANDSRIHFHCKEDSILMVIQHFSPVAMYDSNSLDVWNTKLIREDFFQPEFQNLGLRPLLRKELVALGNTTVDNYIIGYIVPNQYYKVPINRNTGIFNLNYKILISSSGNFVPSSALTSPLRCFTVHTQSTLPTSGNGVSLDYFKVKPSDLDYIFEENYDSQVGDPATDQFYGQVRIGIQITHNMSVHGLPSL